MHVLRKLETLIQPTYIFYLATHTPLLYLYVFYSAYLRIAERFVARILCTYLPRTAEYRQVVSISKWSRKSPEAVNRKYIIIVVVVLALSIYLNCANANVTEVAQFAYCWSDSIGTWIEHVQRWAN